jgi:ring-1,2-phenylacetyl-CoA epoxidase subunit PaaE
MITYSLKVEKLKKETEDTLTIFFKQPALKKVKYLPGQYLTLIFRINGRRYIRPYSFSSAPGIDTTINVTVKRVPGGIVSNHILDKVQAGDIIEVMPPIGDFILPDEATIKGKHIVLWGSGSGITPLLSIAKYTLHNKLADHLTLVYGNRNIESTIFNSEINELKNDFANTFSVWHFHTRAVIDDNSHIVQGRIDPDKILAVLQTEGELSKTLHYICGPVGLKESVSSKLIEFGVSQDHIYTEDFEIVRDPKDFNDIFTQNIILEKEGQSTVLEVVKGKSILEACMDSGIEMLYSCQTGNCLLCRATLLSGSVKAIGIDTIPEEIGQDECLLCCSFPITDNVKVSIKNR